MDPETDVEVCDVTVYSSRSNRPQVGSEEGGAIGRRSLYKNRSEQRVKGVGEPQGPVRA